MNEKLIAGVFALLTFIFWISLVGNPHVVETVIGLVLSLVVFVLVWRSIARRRR